MVRHYHKCVRPNVSEMMWNTRPTLTRDFTEWTQYHVSVSYTSENVRRCADGNEIRPRAGIVMTTQPD